MVVSPSRHQHRHYKTLILLVLSMTAGTFFLFWLGELSPVTPLRGEAPGSRAWNQILVRSIGPDEDRGFFHIRIDEQGRLFQSSAWKTGQHDPRHTGAIHILLTAGGAGQSPTEAQTGVLSRVIADLVQRHRISEDRVGVDGGQALASMADDGRGRMIGS